MRRQRNCGDGDDALGDLFGELFEDDEESPSSRLFRAKRPGRVLLVVGALAAALFAILAIKGIRRV